MRQTIFIFKVVEVDVRYVLFMLRNEIPAVYLIVKVFDKFIGQVDCSCPLCSAINNIVNFNVVHFCDLFYFAWKILC